MDIAYGTYTRQGGEVATVPHPRQEFSLHDGLDRHWELLKSGHAYMDVSDP